MIKHIVLFRFTIDEPASQHPTVQEFAAALHALVGVIPEIRSLEIGFNENPEEEYQMALTVVVDNLEALATYANHPLHRAAGKIKAPIHHSRACVDFTC